MVDHISTLIDQEEIIKPLLSDPLRLSETWYLIDTNWFRKFRLYIGLGRDEDEEDPNAEAEQPGPIDNSALFQNGKTEPIREKLQDSLDYELVSEKVWHYLMEWYGLVDEQQPIARKVIQNGKDCIVEVYHQQLYLCKDFEFEKKIARSFSSSDTLEKVLRVMKEEFEIVDDEPMRLLCCHQKSQYDVLENLENTIHKQGLYENQVVIIAKEDNPMFHNVKNAQSTTTNSQGTYSTRYGNQYSNRKNLRNIQPGLCGLTNLGNTCFMNSVLQCMSNCPPITKYFLENQYIHELNEENPLGMKGEIAKSFGELVKVMWSGHHSDTTPHQFKLQVGRFAPQFYGYQQHDSQELLTFLLDGLHEDLNRIKKKPYIILRDSDGRPDNEVAKEAWDNYLKRNDSVIIDFFHGLLKSTVVCPECNKISITFDPFCYLSLPVPIKRERQIDVILVPNDTNKKLEKHRIYVSKDGKIENLAIALSKLTKIDVNSLILTVISKHHIHKFFSLNDPLMNLEDKEECYAFEMAIHANDKNFIVVPVVLYELNQKQLQGLPLLISVPRNNCTYEMLTNAIQSKMSRNVIIKNNWNCNSNGEGDDKYNNIEEDGEVNNIQKADDNNKTLCAAAGGNGYNNKSFSIHLVLHKVLDQNTDLTLIADDGNLIQFPKNLGRHYLAIKWNSNCVKYKESEMIMPEVHKRPLKLNLNACLELYTTCEKLGASDAWYCPSCKKHQQATKKFDLWSLPKILIIHLKRFSYKWHRRDKIDAYIDFPLRSLDLSKFIINKEQPVNAIYDLIGVCNHYGGMGGGHYTAYAQNKMDGNWYSFDDSHVSSISESSVVSNAAYVLFYMRREGNCEPMDIN